MANLTITAANVAASTKVFTTQKVQAGEALSQGMPAYQSLLDSKFYKTQANDAAKIGATGIVFTPMAADGYGLLITTGDVVIGATIVQGTVYVISRTAGLIAPLGDLISDDYVTILGVAKSSTVLQLNLLSTGIIIP